jgi:hypothetical protein
MMDIGNHADDSPSSILGHHLPDRVLPGPQSASQRLIHHHHGLARLSIALYELSPGLQRDAQGFDVSIGHHANESLRVIVLVIDLSFSPDLPPPVPVKWQDIADPGCGDAGDCAGTLQHIVDECVCLRCGRDLKTRVNPEGSGTFGFKPKIHIQGAQKTLDEQCRADEQ